MRRTTGNPSPMHSGPAPLLAVANLRTHFFTPQGVTKAVDDVSFTVGRGETLAIVGESGCGKTVTGMSIMRLLSRTTARIVGGQMEFMLANGEIIDLARVKERRMRTIRGCEIAMIFQDPMSSLNPVFTIGDQITESIMLHKGVGRREAVAAAIDLLARVGIGAPEQRVKEYPHQLSGGMRQRVMIAIALASDPQLLIADEPTTALDVTIQAQIVTLLKRLQLERQMGMIFVTHNLGLVAEIADRIAVMYSGQVVEQGPTAAVLASPLHPYTKALLGCIPAGRNAAHLEPIPGQPPDPSETIQGCRFQPRCRYSTVECALEAIPFTEIGDGRRSRCLHWKELL